MEEADELQITHGRGLWLMRYYMTCVTHNDLGNEVRAELKRTPPQTEF